MNSLSPIHIEYEHPKVDEYALVRSYLERWGSQSLSYSAIQQDVSYHELAGVGIIPFRRGLGYTVALGNPLCAPLDRAKLIEDFRAAYPRTVFAQVDGEAVDTLRDSGYFCTPVGMDAMIDIPSFSLAGKAKRDLRHYLNRCSASEVRIREVQDTAAKRFELHQLSQRWLRTKKISSHELSFLIRPLSRDPEQGIRIFIAQQGSQTVGFVLFDPMYNQGSITGYTASILRALPNAPEGSLDAITLHALERFKLEGRTSLSLGVMPMHKMKDVAQKQAKGAIPLYHVCRALSTSPWQPLTNMRGLSFHKSRYRPQEVPVFIATQSPIGLGSMTAVTRACGLLIR